MKFISLKQLGAHAKDTFLRFPFVLLVTIFGSLAATYYVGLSHSDQKLIESLVVKILMSIEG